MRLRHVLGLGLAAVLAAGPALVLPTAPALAAGGPRHVAIVISGHGGYCVGWMQGITGDTVLNEVATVAYRSDHLIVQIDGDPSSGTADASHFWSYWHDVPPQKGASHTWTYSTDGASGYDPVAGSVEGWSYDNGSSSPPKPAQYPSGLYQKLCGAKDATPGGGTVPVSTTSSAAPTRTLSSAPGATRTHPATTHSPSAGSPGPRRSYGSGASAPGPAHVSATPSMPLMPPRPSRRPSSARPSGTSSTAVSVAPRSSAAGPPPGARPSTPATIDASPAASSSSSGSPAGLLVGLGLVVVLGAGAGVFALQRRRVGH